MRNKSTFCRQLIMKLNTNQINPFAKVATPRSQKNLLRKGVTALEVVMLISISALLVGGIYYFMQDVFADAVKKIREIMSM